MADQQTEPADMETITLSGEDGTTHIYTMDNTQIISGLPNVAESTAQEVLVENDGNVLYFVQTEAEESEDMQGVSYVVIDEQGNPSETVSSADLRTTDQEQVQYTELTSLELVPTDSEFAHSHTKDLTSVTSKTETQDNTVQPDKTDKQDYGIGIKLDVSEIEKTKEDEDVEMYSEITEEAEENVKYVLCCHCCGEALDTMQELKDHLLEFHDISDDVTEHEEILVDGDIFLNAKDYDNQVAKEHSVRKGNPKPPELQSTYSHKCQFCDKSFDIRSDLENHLETEHDAFDDLFESDKLYHKCPYCPRLYLAKWSSKSLTRHINVDHPGADTNAPIQVIKVKDRSHLRKLKSEIGTGKTNIQFPCHFCPKVFHWQKSLNRHTKLFHEAELDLLSVEDRREILGKERIKKRSKTRDSLENIPCLYCSKAFTWHKSLKRHVFDFHPENMKEFVLSQGDRKSSKLRYCNLDRENVFFKCMHCSLVSKYVHSIKNHMKRKHVKEVENLNLNEILLPTVDAKNGTYTVRENDSRPREERLSECSVVFNCPNCPYATNNPSNLQRHLTSRIHSQNKNSFKMSSFKQKRSDILSPVTESKIQPEKSSEDKANDFPETSIDEVTSADEDHYGSTKEKIQIQHMSDIPELCKEFVNLKVTFRCPDCSTDAFHFETLQDHYKICHPNNPFIVTKENSVVAEHIIKEIKSLKALECPYCDLILSQVHVLEQHASLNHQKCLDQLQIKQEPTEIDNEAGDLYKQDGTLLEPVINKSVVTAYRCCVCECVFPEILNLVKHMGIVHPEVNKSGKGIKRVGRKRKNHEAIAEKADSAAANVENIVVEYANKCPHCSFSCKRASALNFHITFNHAKIKQEPDDEETPRKKIKLDKISDNTLDVVAVSDELASSEIPIFEMSNKVPDKQPRRRGRPPKKLKDKNETLEITSQPKIVEKMHKPDNTRGVGKKGMSNIAANMNKEAIILLKDIGLETGKSDEGNCVSTVKGKTDKTVNEKVTPKKAIKRVVVKASKKDKAELAEEQLKDMDIFDDIDLGGDNDCDTDYEPKLDENHIHVVSPVKPCMRHKCPYCDSGNFLSLRFLEKHVKRVHPDDFQTFSLLDVKAAEPVSDTLHRCCYCKKSFSSQKAVHEHMNTHKDHQSEVDKKKTENRNNDSNYINIGDSNMEIKTEVDEEDSHSTEYEENKYRKSAMKIVRVPRKLRTGSGSVSYKCKYCNVFFSSQSSVIKHAQLVHPQEQKIYSSEIEQLVNATETDIENTYKCPYCDTSSVWKKCIVKHVRHLHPEVTDFTADDILIEIGMCKEIIKSPEISRFQCPFCDSITKWRKSMMRHIRSLHPDKCKGIDLQTMNLEMEPSNTGQGQDRIRPPRRVHCPECDFTCRMIQKMRDHFRANHPEKEDSNTDSLFKYTYITEDIKVEMDSHNEDIKYTHHCHICKTGYVWKKSLVHHMKTSHPADVVDAFDALQSIIDIVDKCSEGRGDVKKYKCRVCLQHYKYRSLLQNHMRSSHPKEAYGTSSLRKIPRAKCTICGFTFKSQLSRQIHMRRTHSYLKRKGKSLGCGVCLRSFTNHLARTKHKACHHVLKKRTNCGHCGKLFSSKKFLVRHEQTCQKALDQSKHGSNSHNRSLLKSRKNSKKKAQQKQSGSDFEEGQNSGMSHKCQLCGKGFSEAQQLREHLLYEYSKKNWHLQGIYRKEKTYSCHSCDESFSLPSIRDQHIADVHKDQTHVCEMCGDIFASTSALKRHYTKHGEDGRLDVRGSCDLCGLTMLKRNLAKHYMYKHPESLVCECDICLNQVDGPGIAVCNVCSMKFCRKMLLQAHKRAEHQLSGNKYKCKYCSKVFFTKRMRYQHLHKHHGQELGRQLAESNTNQPTNDVKETVDVEEGQSTHVIHIGDGQGMQYLPKLSEASLSAVIKELMIVSSDKACKLPYKCLLCGRCFAKTKYIRLHIRRSHVKDEDQPYRCKICGSGFVRLTEFRKHSRSHSGFRPYKCKICAKAFKQQANLMDHMNVHNTTKNFECFICRRRFRQRGALNAHIIHHDKLKPFKCIFCDKGFTTRGELSRHMQHYDLGEGKSNDSRSFMCHICQESFYHFPILLKHIEERHPERPFSCVVCGEKFAAFISLYTHKMKNGHFLASDIEPELDNEAASNVRKIKRSTKDIQDAVYAIEQSKSNEEHGIVKNVNDSVVVIQPLEVIEDQLPGATVEVVIEQFPPDEGRETPNESEELLSIAKQLTELSTYTENEQGEVENASLLQEEDELIKDMLDADQDLLANIGKQLVVTREEETSTAEEYDTVMYTDTDRIKVSQGVDLVVNIDGTEQSEYVIAQEKNEVVTNTTIAKAIPTNMEELATLIAQNSQLGLGDSVSAYQTQDGAIIYVCMDNQDQGEEAVYDVPASTEYQESNTQSIIVKDINTHDVVQEEMIIQEQNLTEKREGRGRRDNEEGKHVGIVSSAVQEREDIIVRVQSEVDIEQSVINGFSQEVSASTHQDYNEDTQKVVEYMHGEQTFIEEELIDTNYTKCKMITDSADIVDSKVARYVYDQNVFKCMKCDYQCSTKKNMRKHLARHTPFGNRQHVCQECEKRFVTKSELARHMTSHTGERRYECKYCDKRFKQPGHLQEHIKIHLGQKDNFCRNCPAKFITKQQLKTHWQRSHSKEHPTCDECGKVYSDKSALIKHKGAVHSQVLGQRKQPEETGAFQCHICGSSFTKNTRLQDHLVQHKPEEERRKFVCEMCGVSFRANHLLSDHKRLEHSDQKPEICEYCGNCYKLKKQLNLHIRTMHRKRKEAGKKVFRCGCGKQFANRNALSYHIGTSETCGKGTFTVCTTDS